MIVDGIENMRKYAKICEKKKKGDVGGGGYDCVGLDWAGLEWTGLLCGAVLFVRVWKGRRKGRRKDGKKEGKKEGRKDGKKEGKKEGKKDGKKERTKGPRVMMSYCRECTCEPGRRDAGWRLLGIPSLLR